MSEETSCSGNLPAMAENIYKVSRRIKRTEQTLYNALRSIYEDALFVKEIRDLWNDLPLLANLRCGLWYASEFDGICYFKSTDGHNGNWSFSPIRLNLHVAKLAAERGGCCVVDATRKGKRFPDSMSKTIPIWACVLNRALADFRSPPAPPPPPPGTQDTTPLSATDTVRMDKTGEDHIAASSEEDLQIGTWAAEDWDCSLHLPTWVSQVEKANIQSRIEGWVTSLKSAGANLASLAKLLKKPLRPLWISQKSVIWLNEVPELDDLSFTPIILVSASRPSLLTERFADAEFSWSYIAGAADDEESWARGLTPALFWKNSLDIIRGGPSVCHSRVADIVERDRVYRAVRGHHAPQMGTKGGVQNLNGLQKDKGEETAISYVNDGLKNHYRTSMELGGERDEVRLGLRVNGNLGLEGLSNRPASSKVPIGSISASRQERPTSIAGFHWIGDTGLAVGRAECGSRENIYGIVDCVINCDTATNMTSNGRPESCLNLPILGPKFDRHSLQDHLAEAVAFCRAKLLSRLTIFICCSNGEDISVCVCLAVLLSCFNARGQLRDSLSSTASTATVTKKSDIRERLIYLSSFNSDARPSRGSLRQVFNFFHSAAAPENEKMTN